jgi:hypothetical protein
MGYQDITLYHLKFEKRDGLEVTVEGLSTGDMLAAMSLMAGMPTQAEAAKADAAKGLTPEMAAAIEQMMAMLAGALDSWNVEDRKGEPVPLTLDGLKSLKMTLVMDIINAWMSAQTGPDPTSPPGSSDGATAADIPMTPMSPGS